MRKVLKSIFDSCVSDADTGRLVFPKMSLWCAWYYKHATLIRNVYPQNPGEEGPRASALSLLLFYATSKPQKLSKIGRFLENRVQTDLRSHKYGHVRVSLDIINMLLQ